MQSSSRSPRLLALPVAALLAAAGLVIAFSGSTRAAWNPDCLSPTQTFGAGNMPSNMNLTAADVILFTDGTFTGSSNSSGATICVDVAAAFNPSNVNGASRMFVRGNALMPPLAAGSGALLDNEGSVVFQPQPNTNGIVTVINRAGASLVVQSGLALGPGVTVTNDGVLEVQGGVNFNGAAVTNSNQLTVAGAWNISGSLTNTGVVTANGLLTVNGDGTIVNNCSLTASAGLINDNTVTNNGVIDLGSAELRNNSGDTYSQGAGAITIGGTFTNPGNVGGLGEYLFSGTTLTQGSFVGSSATEPIVFFDSTQTGSQIFDTQLGAISNVIRAAVIPPAPGACSATPPTTTTTTSTTTTTTTTSTTLPPTTTTSTSSTTTTSTTTTSTTSTTTTSTTSTTLPPTTLPPTTSTSTTSTTSTSTTSTTPAVIAPTTTAVGSGGSGSGGTGLPGTGSSGSGRMLLSAALFLMSGLLVLFARGGQPEPVSPGCRP